MRFRVALTTSPNHGSGDGSLGPGAGRTVVITNATTTATTTCGVTDTPSVPSNRVANSTEVRGRRNIAALIAPMPMATAGARLIPGNPAAAVPRTAPTNMAGNTGPPRNALSETPYANDLQTASRISTPTE